MPTIIAVVMYALSYTPLAHIYLQYAVNQNLVFTLRYLSVFILILGFRGNYPSLKAIHKTIAIFIGIVPTAYSIMASGLVLLSVSLTVFVSLLSGAVETDMIRGVLEGMLFWAFSASITVGTWLLITRRVFAQYRYPYDLDEQSKIASVAALLMFFGMLGVHRFFVGKIVSGICFLMTMGFLGIGVIYDGIMLILRRSKDAEGHAI